MGIVEDVRKLVSDAEGRLNEARIGVGLLKSAGVDITERELAVEELAKKVEGLKEGLEKYE